MTADVSSRDMRTPLIALLISFGSVHFSVILAQIAIPWFVLETTGSAARTGITAAVHGVPMIIAGIFGGVIVDRLGFRRTVVISDAFSGLAYGMIPLLYFTTGITFWQLLIFVFLGSAFDTPGFTARVSLMPDVAERAMMRLERANSISQTLMQFTILAAPALTGLLIGVIGASAVLWINSGLFWLSAVVVGLLIPQFAPSSRAEVQGQSRYLGELRRGMAFVFGSGLILALIMAVTLVHVLRASLMVIMPVYAHANFGRASDFGFMFAAMGAGGLVSALLFGILGHWLPRWPVIVLGMLGPLVAFAVLAFTPPYFVILCGLAVAGLMSGSMLPLVFTLMQGSTPADLRGRVFGLYDAGMFSMAVPGRLFTGYLIEWTGIVQSLIYVAAGCLVGVVAIASNPHLRNIPRPDTDAVVASTTEDLESGPESLPEEYQSAEPRTESGSR